MEANPSQTNAFVIRRTVIFIIGIVPRRRDLVPGPSDGSARWRVARPDVLGPGRLGPPKPLDVTGGDVFFRYISCESPWFLLVRTLLVAGMTSRNLRERMRCPT